MNNFYSVGERVLLRSPNLPEYDGEYTIEAILIPFEEFTCRFTGADLYTDGGVSYVLDTPLLDLIVCNGTEAIWSGSSLRKLHEGGELSYQGLIESIKIL